MSWTNRNQRRLFGVLAAVVSLSLGCRTTGPSTRPIPPVPESPVTEVPGELGLGVEQELRAAALAHFATGNLLVREQGPDVALPYFREAFNLDPANTGLALFLANEYRARRDMTNAFAVLDTAISAAPKSGEPWVAKGLTHRADDDLTNAVASFRQALKLEPTHPGANRALVEVALSQNDTNTVVSVLDQGFRQKSSSPAYWVALGDLHIFAFRQRPTLALRIDRARVRQCYERARGLDPQNPEILSRLGDSYLEANEFTTAAEVYAKLVELRPYAPQLRERLGALYLKTDQKEQAVALYKELIKRDPLRYEYYSLLGELCIELGKDEEGLGYFEQSLKLNPERFETYLDLAEVQRRLKRTDALHETLATWKKKYPTDWRVPYFSAVMQVEAKDHAAALAAFADADTLARETQQEFPITAQFYFAYGATSERAGDIEKAATQFKKALALNPKLASAHNYIGYMWADKGLHLTEALEHIEQAVALEPGNAAYLDSLGWVLHKLNRNEEALQRLREAVAALEQDTGRDPEEMREDAVIYDHLAEVLQTLGQTNEAVRTWKRALELDPENKDIPGKFQKHAPN